MQRPRLLFLLFFLVIFPLSFDPFTASAAEDPLRTIRQLSDEVYRISQEMVDHGSEGHTDEVSLQAKKMAETTERLIEAVQSSQEPKLQNLKKKIMAPLKGALKKAKEAARLADQKKALPALDAARKASYQAKRSRQEIQAIH